MNHCLHYEIGCSSHLVDIFLEPEEGSWLLSWVIISENSLLTEVNMIAKKNQKLLPKIDVLWRIWKHRCFCVFNHANPNLSLIASSAFHAALTIPNTLLLIIYPHNFHRWQPLPMVAVAAWHSDWYCCNCVLKTM